jgi:glutathione S-transferase
MADLPFPRLYHFANSGNSYKIRLLLAELGCHYASVPMDRYKREQKEPGYLAVNPRGQVLALEVAPGKVLVESAAILCYLADGTPFLPADPWARAHVVSWLLYEQEHLANQGVGMAHYWVRVTGEIEAKAAEIAAARAKAAREFVYLERHLTGRAWLVGEAMTIADIAGYGYTHRAEISGVPLEPYPAVRAWHARIRARPRHIPFEAV